MQPENGLKILGATKTEKEPVERILFMVRRQLEKALPEGHRQWRKEFSSTIAPESTWGLGQKKNREWIWEGYSGGGVKTGILGRGLTRGGKKQDGELDSKVEGGKKGIATQAYIFGRGWPMLLAG